MHADADSALGILALALLIDGVLGEYPAALHPVVWMGKASTGILQLAPTAGWWRQLIFGILLTTLMVSLSAGLAWLFLQTARFHPLAEILIGAFLLKGTFALRELGRAALNVVTPLEAGDLGGARWALRSLCSRAAHDLSPAELLAAAIESLAENTSDSFVAPLFFYVLFGVPGAVAYRAINTLDAMIGYLGKFEALGKGAARLDDLVNFLPARLTALLFLGAGCLLRAPVANGWRILRRDCAKTPSPNGGRPMAVMAGLLNVQLDKKGVYSLGEPREPLTPAKVRQAWRLVGANGLLAAALSALAVWALTARPKQSAACSPPRLMCSEVLQQASGLGVKRRERLLVSKPGDRGPSDKLLYRPSLPALAPSAPPWKNGTCSKERCSFPASLLRVCDGECAEAFLLVALGRGQRRKVCE